MSALVALALRHGRALALVALIAFAGWEKTRGDRLEAHAAQLTRAVAAQKTALADRDRRLAANAARDAEARGRSDRTCAADISNAFQRGAAVGRAMSHATARDPDPDPAAGEPGRVRDYRSARKAAAFTPRR